MTILYILLFVVCLSVLIIVHELGHLAAAKAFKVYCFEYSIGFGPKLFSFKRKNGETKVSLRGIPFGGYVSMYGEGMELPEGVEIPPERSLEGIKKWKKAIILVAGVTMNAVLALLIFAICNTCFPVTQYYLRNVTISETNTLSDDSFKTGDIMHYVDYIGEDEDSAEYFVLTKNATVTLANNDEESGISVLMGRVISNENNLDWAYFLHFAKLDDNKQMVKAYEPSAEYSKYTFTVDFSHTEDGEKTPVTMYTTVVKNDDDTYSLSPLGIGLTREEIWLKGKAFKQTFVDFGQSSTAIVKALGSLFVSKEAREGTGGIIAIGFETTRILQNFGVDSFLRVWGLVSVNLAIINLLPFPGLDGWQLLVLIVEGISKKKIPDKVKNIVSLVGLALLFALMILLVVKDVIKYII